MPLRMNDEPRVGLCCCRLDDVLLCGRRPLAMGSKRAAGDGMASAGWPGVVNASGAALTDAFHFESCRRHVCTTCEPVSVGEATQRRCSLDERNVSCWFAGPQTCQRGATVQVTRRRRRSRGEPRSHSSRLCFRSQRVRASAVLGSALILARVPVGRGACLGHGVGPSGSSRTCLIAVARQQRGKRWRGKGET